MSDAAVKIQNLSKMYRLYRRPMDKVLDAFGLNFWRKNYYQEFWALRDINLEVKRGERVGIIGRNGAGKSTLLKIITGNVQPTEGNVTVNGSLQALLELGTGFHPEFTGRENIRASLAYQGLSTREIAEKEEEIIDFAELEDFIDQPIKTYSAGMYARLAFSTATAIKPDILIIDEVLGAGDAYFTGKCVERMRTLTGEGATVLFVSHDLASVQMLCERVIWIDRGRIKAEGEPLPIVKAYMAEVRKEEEIRLKAKDLRIQKKRAAQIEKIEDFYRPLLFHFIVDGKHPKETHPIFTLRLFSGDKEIGTINVGDAMDNSPEYLHYLMDDKGLMDWGPSKKMNGRWCREYKDCQGKYCHAPFQFMLPKTLEHKDMFLIVEYQESQSESFCVEYYDGKKYKYLASLESKKPGNLRKAEIVFTLPEEDLAEKNNEQEIRKASVSLINCAKDNKEEAYGSREIEILNFELLGEDGYPRKVFVSGETMVGRFYYRARLPVTNPTFVVCIYRAEGFCASQVFLETKEIGLGSINGEGIVEVIYDPLLLGKGSYVVSIGIFKYCNLKDPSENPAYCVWDRAIHFQVNQPENIYKELGLIVHPVKWKFRDIKKVITL